MRLMSMDITRPSQTDEERVKGFILGKEPVEERTRKYVELLKYTPDKTVCLAGEAATFSTQMIGSEYLMKCVFRDLEWIAGTCGKAVQVDIRLSPRVESARFQLLEK